MYIMSEDSKQIINSDFVERFAIADKGDAALILASYSPGDEKRPITIGRYKDMKEAKNVLADMMLALAGEQSCYYMPESSYYHHIEPVKKDARVKRKGGS